MKFENTKSILQGLFHSLPLLCMITPVQSFTIFSNEANSYTNNSSFSSKYDVEITEDQLNNFNYGSSEFTLAIIGDSGTEKEANRVMELSSFDALLHLGDFDYACKPDKYFTDVLKRDYTFMGVMGNHEGVSECGTEVSKKFLSNIYYHMKRSSSVGTQMDCTYSNSGYMWSCRYQNMRVIGLSVAINGAPKRSEQLSFLKEEINKATEDWKICAWHFYDDYYHTGKYQDHHNHISDDGESFYDICRRNGAIIASAHDHVYARSKVMSSYGEHEIDQYNARIAENILEIRSGATPNLLNGVGGYEIYIESSPQKDYRWWQKRYAKGSSGENEKKYGGMFCKFNVGGNSNKAYCELRRINTSTPVFDNFTIYRNEDPVNIKPREIDEAFANAKLIAYKKANNIPLDNNEANSNSTSILDDSKTPREIEEPSKFSDFMKSTPVLITFPTVIVAALLIGSLFVYRRRSRRRRRESENQDFNKKYDDKKNRSKNTLPPPSENDYTNYYTNKNVAIPIMASTISNKTNQHLNYSNSVRRVDEDNSFNKKIDLNYDKKFDMSDMSLQINFEEINGNQQQQQQQQQQHYTSLHHTPTSFSHKSSSKKSGNPAYFDTQPIVSKNFETDFELDFDPEFDNDYPYTTTTTTNPNPRKNSATAAAVAVATGSATRQYYNNKKGGHINTPSNMNRQTSFKSANSARPKKSHPLPPSSSSAYHQNSFKYEHENMSLPSLSHHHHQQQQQQQRKPSLPYNNDIQTSGKASANYTTYEDTYQDYIDGGHNRSRSTGPLMKQYTNSNDINNNKYYRYQAEQKRQQKKQSIYQPIRSNVNTTNNYQENINRNYHDKSKLNL